MPADAPVHVHALALLAELIPPRLIRPSVSAVEPRHNILRTIIYRLVLSKSPELPPQQHPYTNAHVAIAGSYRIGA